MAETHNIVLEHLLHIRAAIDHVRNDISEMMQPIAGLERRYCKMSDRLDRMDLCIERIERRLDLTDV